MASQKHQYAFTNSDVLKLFSTVGAEGNIFPLSQILTFLKDYVKINRLYDPKNPLQINAENDPIGKAFGKDHFDAKWAMSKLCTFLRPVAQTIQPVPERNEAIGEGSSTECGQSQGETSRKRKNSEGVENSPKKNCHLLPIQCLIGPPCNSEDESVHSYQGYETALVKDTTDDYFSEDDNYYSQSEGENVFFIDESNQSGSDIEYEVLSLPRGPDTDSGSDDNFIAEIIVHDVETDLEFWADSSNCGSDSTSDDPDITESDKWQCKHCNGFSNPTVRYCERCWNLRQNWLPENRRPPKRLRKKRPRKAEKPRKKKLRSERLKEFTLGSQGSSDVSDGQQTETASTSFEGPSSQSSEPSQTSTDSVVTDPPLCILCLERPQDGCIVHQSTGHMMGCFQCLKKLKRNDQPCPICRGPILKVIRVFRDLKT